VTGLEIGVTHSKLTFTCSLIAAVSSFGSFNSLVVNNTSWARFVSLSVIIEIVVVLCATLPNWTRMWCWWVFVFEGQWISPFYRG